MRELAEFVLELSNFEKYLYSKFGKGLTLKIREKMSVSGGQSYKEIVQLALRAKKFTGEKMSHGKFQERKGFRFVSGQSSKKSHNSESFGNSSGFETDSISSLKTFRSLQPSRLGISPPNSTFRGRMMFERCPYCKQFHLGVSNMP